MDSLAAQDGVLMTGHQPRPRLASPGAKAAVPTCDGAPLRAFTRTIRRKRTSGSAGRAAQSLNRTHKDPSSRDTHPDRGSPAPRLEALDGNVSEARAEHPPCLQFRLLSGPGSRLRGALSPRLRPLRWLGDRTGSQDRSEEHTSELQSRENLVCRLLLEKKNNTRTCLI